MFRAVVASISILGAGCGLLLDSDLRRSGADGGTDASRDAAPRDSASSDAVPPDAPDASDASPPDAITSDATPPPPSGCGGPTALVDDFEDGVTSDRWRVLGRASEAGTLDFPFSSGETNLYYSTFAYDLRDDWVAVRVVSAMPGSSTFLGVAIDDGAQAYISIDDSRAIRMHRFDGTSSTIGYVPAEHVWLGVGESGGTIEFKTSSDGLSWTIQDAFGAPSPLPPVRLQLGVFGIAGSGTVRFDDFNLDGAHPIEPHCFPTAVDVSQRFRFWVGNAYTGDADPSCASYTGGGGLRLSISSSGSDKTCEYASLEAFDLRDHWLVVEIESETVGSGYTTYLALIDTRWAKMLAILGGDWAWLGVGGTGRGFPYLVDGARARHMRLGHFSGQAVVELSLDGADWRRAAMLPASPGFFEVSAVQVAVGVDVEAGVSGTNAAVIANFGGTGP